MANHALHQRAEIVRLAPVVRLRREDCGRISESRRALSLKSNPPPTIQLSDDDVRVMLEPRKIRWHPDLLPDYRDVPIVSETVPYFRYSTDKQEHSIEHQQYAFAEWYGLRQSLFSLPPVTTKLFADPETSGGKRLFERRWGGQFGRYIRPGDHVVFVYFDRMGRNAIDTLQSLDAFVRLGVFVHVLDHAQFQFCDPRHPNTIKQIHDAASAAEYERRMASERTRRCHRSHLAKNIALGNIGGLCYRKTPNPAYVPGVIDSMTNPRFTVEFSPFEAAICEEVYRCWLVESWSVYEICKALRNRAKKDRRFLRFGTGKPWDKHGVKYVIRKLHAERGQGGAAGMFQTAALNGLAGMN